MSEPVILVALDASERAPAAMPVAKVLAGIEQAALRIVRVAERSEQLGSEAPMLDGFTVDARIGDPAAEILHVAEEMKPLLIVMSTSTAPDREKMLVSTATKVLRNAPYPVVLVPSERGSTPWHLQHVLVPHDGTPTTSAALRPAAELAERAGAELLVAHVTDISAAPAEPGSLTTPLYVDQPQHEWPAWTSEFLERLACICPLGHLHARIFLANGNPVVEIVRLAKKQTTDLMVLAWRREWEAPRAATLKGILREAHCPVMVVRA